MAATSTGTVFPRCACRSAETGKQLGARCARRGQPGHGRWYYDVPGPDARQQRLRKGGFLTRAAAELGLAEVCKLPGPEAMAETWTMQRWLEYWLSAFEWLSHGRSLPPRILRSSPYLSRGLSISLVGMGSGAWPLRASRVRQVDTSIRPSSPA